MDHGAYYLNLWQKSLYFELVNRAQPNILEEAFALSLPPQSIDVVEPQRIAETKTYGGLFVDDYGPDVAKITISGTTGNSEVRQVYTKDGVKWLDGKNEIYWLRERLMRYKRKYRGSFEQLEMRLYDLSAFSAADARRIQATTGPVNPRAFFQVDGWVVILKDFRISRTKDQPMMYRYTIELTGVQPLGAYRPIKSYPVIRPESVLGRLSRLEQVLAFLNDVYRTASGPLRKINQAREAVQRAHRAVSQFSAGIQQILSVPGQLVDAAVGVVGDSVNVLKAARDGYYGAAQQALSFPLDAVITVQEACNAVARESIAFFEAHNHGRPFPNGFLPEGILRSLDDKSEPWRQVEEWYSTAVLSRTVVSVRESDRAVMDGLSVSMPSVNFLATETGQFNAVLTYGDREVLATSETRLEQLAEQYLGNPDLAVLIASYNGLTGNDDIVPGALIRIPLLEQQPQILNNQIFALPEHRDAMGTDIRLDVDGRIVIGEFGDVAVVSGTENLEQAIRLRLAEAVGRRLRLSVYGIRNEIGSADSLALAYLATSVKDTVMQDPRVTDVDEMMFNGDGDAVIVTFTYRTVNGIAGQYKGRFS